MQPKQIAIGTLVRMLTVEEMMASDFIEVGEDNYFYLRRDLPNRQATWRISALDVAKINGSIFKWMGFLGDHTIGLRVYGNIDWWMVVELPRNKFVGRLKFGSTYR